MGVWIEINVDTLENNFCLVTPHVRVWIEMQWLGNFYLKETVTPHVGVWIEIGDPVRP